MSARPLATICLALLAVPVRADDAPPETTKFEDLKPLAATIARADKLVLHEGLPHPFEQKRDFLTERAGKETVELAGWPFYADPLPLKDADAKKLSGLLAGEDTYRPFGGEKKCGGFHPDYAVEWRVGKDRYLALVCFGCSEIKVFGPAGGVRADLGKDGPELAKVLKPHRKNRPRASGE